METGDVPDFPQRLTTKINADLNFALNDTYEHFTLPGRFEVRVRLTPRSFLQGRIALRCCGVIVDCGLLSVPVAEGLRTIRHAIGRVLAAPSSTSTT